MQSGPVRAATAHPSEQFSGGIIRVTNRMDIQELTARMHRFVESKGWYADKSPRPQTPRNLAISLALEAAEVLEHFQWDDSQHADIADELADVMLYLLQLASLEGIDLENAVLSKLERNYTREWPSDDSA
jgi:NTP pyrophosphatase (non-canonical NTP hydrolase)